jgi:hypothetical protein
MSLNVSTKCHLQDQLRGLGACLFEKMKLSSRQRALGNKQKVHQISLRHRARPVTDVSRQEILGLTETWPHVDGS